MDQRLSLDDVVAASVKRRGLQACASSLYWLEQRPQENGRGVIVRYDPQTKTRQDITPSSFSVRSKVYEYGGGDFLVTPSGVFFVNASDQQIYRQTPQGVHAVTSCNEQTPNTRYADFTFCAQTQTLYCVRETHQKEVVNDIVAVSLTGTVDVIVSGDDFYAAPRLSCDAKKLCWLQWSFPNMPWDQCRLMQLELHSSAPSSPYAIVSDATISVLSPQYDANNRLWFVDDRDGDWRVRNQQKMSAYTPSHSDCGIAAWSMGQQPFVVLDDDTVAGLCLDSGVTFLTINEKKVSPPFAECGSQLVVNNHHLYFFASTATTEETLIDYALKTATFSADILPTKAFFSAPEAIIHDGIQAFFYSTTTIEPSPLVVFCHSGPTGLATAALNLHYQFWLQQGFAILDINYRGSYGFGRHYRQALMGRWGELDVSDCRAMLDHVIATRCIDSHRVYLRGNSAGGLTALRWLAMTPSTFRAAALRYPVVDLSQLHACSHKFEAGYLGQLLGSQNVREPVWHERSPMHQADRIQTPLLISQGSDDPVVPLRQSQMLQKTLQRQNKPCDLLVFNGEGHGFRRSESLKTVLQAEVDWFSHHR